MKILYSALLLTLLVSCNQQQIYVPQADVSLVTNVRDYSTIAFLYEIKNDSVMIDVKDKTIITQTNWLYEIDKRLPLHLIFPEVQRLQAKKLKKAKEEQMPSYYTYMDTVAKAIAYLPVAQLDYNDNQAGLKADDTSVNLKVNAQAELFLNDEAITSKDLNSKLATFSPNQVITLYLEFDKNLSFEKYVQTKLQLAKITLPNVRLATTEVMY